MTDRMQALCPILALIFGALLLAGCAGSTISVGDYPDHRGHDQRGYERHERRGGPPPWAPAHGYRAKHRYRYYPSAEVYFDTGRGLYFYYTDGEWRGSVRLPRYLRAELGSSVTLEMDTSHPYEYHPSVTERYPPGRGKKKHKDRWKN